MNKKSLTRDEASDLADFVAGSPFMKYAPPITQQYWHKIHESLKRIATGKDIVLEAQ